MNRIGMKATSTTERSSALVGPAPRLRAAALAALIPALLVLAALVPRAWGLADFLTTDEAYHWISRTERFATAVAEGRWGATNITGHPGVTLMWLGALGLRLEQLAVGLGWAAAPDRLGHLAWLRLGPVVVNALGVGAGYLLLRRLVRPAVAAGAAILWATSPFLVAHGRLLHLDALLTTFSTLTILSALVACRAERPRPWLILTGALGGLALLTKGPALILLPFVGLAMFALGGPPRRPGLVGWVVDGLRWSLPRYLLFLAVAAVAVLLLWPALWSTPSEAVARYVAEIVGNGGRPNGDGQFFLGSSNADPGPLFYPVAALFRLTPVELLGVVLAAGFAVAAVRGRRALGPQATIFLALALFVLWWLLVMTAGPKKFDRYILPFWPILLTFAAAGLVGAAEWLAKRSPVHMLLSACCILTFQALTLAWFHPYYLSYYSPLLGGGPVAQRTFLIGWGEGMDQVGAWLRERPDVASGQILSALPPTLEPFVPVPVREVRTIDAVPANYAVVYLESIQRGDAPEIYARIRETIPLATVRIHGIDYAWIHQLARPFDTPVAATFGEALRLRGYSARAADGQLVVTPSWDVRAPLPADLMLFIHVLDPAGNRVAAVDVPPGGASVAPTSQWLPGEQVGVPVPIALPAGLPPGQYTLTLGLYDPASFARLPLTAGPAADPATAGPDAALLGQVTLP
jgi:4-amino-4-deoxy-L-arabinose transferase-like glycosyltransferase